MFMSRSKVSLIFDGVLGETIMHRPMPENKRLKSCYGTRIYFDCSFVFFQSRFMSRSKVSLIFDGVLGEAIMHRQMPDSKTEILLRHTNLF